jgi:hypothetical protein
MPRIISLDLFRRLRNLSVLVSVLAVAMICCTSTASAQGLRGRFRNPDQDPRRGQDQDSDQAERPEPTPVVTQAEQAVFSWLDRLDTIVPQRAADFGGQNVDDFNKATDATERWAAEAARFTPKTRPGEVMLAISYLLTAKDRVDALLNRTLQTRTGFAPLDAKGQATAIRHFLATTEGLIDLSGRLRYMLFDVLNFASDAVSDRSAATEQLIDMLRQHRSSVGAVAMAPVLSDPNTDDADDKSDAGLGAEAGPRSVIRGRNAPQVREAARPAGLSPTKIRLKRKVLDLIAATGQTDLYADLADFVRDPGTPPELLVAAVETIRQIGLPQDVRPGQDPQVPAPAITARELYGLLARVRPETLPRQDQQRATALLNWLSQRAQRGIAEDIVRIGTFDVQPGDWLLMRNPSPYNLFTDLSPGLFTHVGVIAAETGKDGIRRLVLVDLPERGTSMPATNVDAFVARSLHYVFLRHSDPEVGRKMGETALSLIGSPTEFDLNFQTDRVTALRGQPLAGKKIHTYCAGFLLLCAESTGRPDDEFFPVPEKPAGGNTVANLAKLGITFGNHFISPTGALFSPQMQIVGRREPMYDPQREVEEAIYDHFAENLATKVLTPSPDLFQSLRQKVVEASKGNPVLTRAIANAAHVDKDLDLVSAAKTQAVVETLDEIAYGNSGQYIKARHAIMEGAPPKDAAAKDPAAKDAAAKDEDAKPKTPQELAEIAEYRGRHPELTAQWDQNQINPRTLRIELVKYYTAKGQRELDARFFSDKPAR